MSRFIGDRRLTLAERIRRLVVEEDRGHVTPCWIWQSVARGGYPRIKMGGRKGRFASAHRVSYEAFIGRVPDGMEMDHLCRVTLCCNPTHLEPVTRQENMRRVRGIILPGKRGQRGTHCSHGHEFTPENTRYTSDGRRCRECHRLYQQQWRRRPERVPPMRRAA